MQIWTFLALYAICIFGCRVGADERPSVTTKVGVINGEAKQVEFNDQKFVVNRFLGIRYGKPPTGDLRFKKSVPYGEFTEPLEAINYGSGCPQLDMWRMGLNSTEEDCLYLNIMVPVQEPDESNGHAVMVYIHGGGFFMGASHMVNTATLASIGNVIVVSINYRLGLFGFLNIGDDRIQGNLGFWDQRLALQWVNENIGKFGGDNKRVTIFGDSAGAMSAFYQGMYPPNSGLFQNIIAQSGTASMPFGIAKDNAQQFTELAEMTGCALDTLDSKLACIQSTDTESIMQALGNSAMQKPPEGLEFKPTIDGEIIKRDPLVTVMEHSQDNPFKEIEFLRSLHLINGMNGADGAMWLPFTGRDPETIAISREEMRDMHIKYNLPLIFGKDTPIEDVILDLIASEYTDWTDLSNARKQFVKFNGDIHFNVPGYENSLIHSNSPDSKSWFYRFEANTDIHILPTPSWIETANHGDEGMSVFGYHSDFLFTGYKPPKWQVELSQRIMTYWTNFAKNGNPNGMNPEKETWPAFTTESQTHMRFNKEDSTGQYLFAKEHNFWRKTVVQIMDAMKHCSSSPFTSKKKDTCGADGLCD